MPKLQEKPSALKGEHPVLKNMRILDFFYFSGSFLPSCIRIRNLNADLDPATQINADPCGSGYGSETLPLSKAFKSEILLEMPKKIKMVVTVLFILFTFPYVGFSLSKLAFKNVF
jgi:hypothetical protein